MEINLLLPEELYSLVWDRIAAQSNVSYSRVNMTLLDLIEKDFLNAYVKSGTSKALLNVLFFPLCNARTPNPSR